MERNKKSSVVSSNVIVHKKSLGSRAGAILFRGNLSESRSGTMKDIVEPNLRRLVYDSIVGFLDRLINGNSPYSSGTSFSRSGGVSLFNPGTSYSSLYTPQTTASKLYSGDSMNPETLMFENSRDAEKVLDACRRQILEFSTCTVLDYYDFAGYTSKTGYTDKYYGWTNLDSARVRSEMGKYMIIMPPTTYIG